MTRTKEVGECPLCNKLLRVVSKHLKQFHHVDNVKERGILNNMATGRVKLGGGVCPILQCNTYVLHLEKHIRAHSDVTQHRIKREVGRLKKETGLAQLAALRASDPAPPMVSRLDLQQEEEEDPEEGPAGCPGCAGLRRQVQDLEQTIRDLRQEVQRVSGSKNPHQSFFSFTLTRNSITNLFLTFSTAARPAWGGEAEEAQACTAAAASPAAAAGRGELVD